MAWWYNSEYATFVCYFQHTICSGIFCFLLFFYFVSPSSVLYIRCQRAQWNFSNKPFSFRRKRVLRQILYNLFFNIFFSTTFFSLHFLVFSASFRCSFRFARALIKTSNFTFLKFEDFFSFVFVVFEKP